MKERLSGRKGYLALAARGVVESGNGVAAFATEGWYKITAKAAVGSIFGELMEGDLFYNKPARIGATGDIAVPLTPRILAFVKDVPNSRSKEKFDNTTQVDEVKSYEEGTKVDASGSFSGYMIDGDDDADEILNRFTTIIEDNGAGAVVRKSLKGGVLDFFLYRKKTAEVGEVEIIDYIPSYMDQLQTDKPMDGPQLFNGNYTVVGSERPSQYRRTITA